MWERAELATFIDFQKPNYGRKQYNRRFYKEVSLFLHPTFIEVQHDGITGFIRIRNISHQFGSQRITAVAFSWIVEVDYIKFRWYLITVSILNQMVISDNRQVIKLKIIYIKRIGLLDCLLYIIVDYGIRLTATRCTQNHACPKRIHYINPAFPFFAFIPELGRQIDGILVFHEFCFLHEGFILTVENVFQQVVLQQAAYP